MQLLLHAAILWLEEFKKDIDVLKSSIKAVTTIRA